MLEILTWKVKLKGGPITPGSSSDSSGFISYWVVFESLFEIKNKTKEQEICDTASEQMFQSQTHNKADISPTLRSNYLPALILLRISQRHQTTLFQFFVLQVHSFHANFRELQQFALFRKTLRSWQTEWRGGLLRISVSNRYHWNYQLCSIPRHHCWENKERKTYKQHERWCYSRTQQLKHVLL